MAYSQSQLTIVGDLRVYKFRAWVAAVVSFTLNNA